MSASARVGIDLTPLAGPRTGVGVMVAEIVPRLAASSRIKVSGLVVSIRGRAAVAAAAGRAMPLRHLPIPARACHLMWRHVDVPSVGGYDVVWGPNFVVPPARGGAELVTVHDLTPWRYPEMVTDVAAAFPSLVERAVNRGAHIHTVSDFVAAELIDEGYDAERIHVIRNGVTRLTPGDAIRGRRLAGGGRYVAAIGTIEPRKDHVGLIEAVAQLDDVRLVVAGPDGWGLDAFERAAARSGLGDRLVRLGYISELDKADLLTGAEALVFPSVYEGFGLPILEAMSLGVPVVATRAGAVSEVAGDAALLVPTGDPTALATAIGSVLDSPELRHRLSASGKARVELFDWDTSAAAMAELLGGLGASSSGGTPER